MEGRGGGVVVDVHGGGVGHAAKAFRLQCKRFSLTYPRCGVERETFERAFRLQHSGFSTCVCAKERHKDGGFHFHVFLEYEHKKDVQSAAHFDLQIEGDSFHPNIQKTKNKKAWLKYIAKEGDHGAIEMPAFDPRDYEVGKKKASYLDLEWEREFLIRKHQQDIAYPIKLVCAGKTYEMHKPDIKLKKRSWWLVAAPSAGKTKWVNKTFAGCNVYCPREGDYPFEGYQNQEIIIYDDRTKVPFSEFSAVLNKWDIIMPVVGKVRYTTQNWPLGHTRSCVVLSNKTIEESMPQEDWVRMKKRFIQIVNPVLLDEDDSDAEDGEEDVEERAIAPAGAQAGRNDEYAAFAS